MASSGSSGELVCVSQANNHLALSLYKLLATEGKNVFFSPFSVSTALAMLFFGTRTESSVEMRSVLGYDIAGVQDDQVKSCYQQLLAAVEKNKDFYTLTSANCVVSSNQLTVKEEFKSLLQEYFKASLREVDFLNESKKAVQEINDWVKEKTEGMIPQLLESLDSDTVMVLLNAVYFKGFWLNSFNERDTFPQYFYNRGDKDDNKRVDMMHLKKTFPYSENKSFKALQLPYKGEDISMLILLPNARNGLEELENSLSLAFLCNLKKDMRNRKVEVAFPKFRLEYSKSLKDPFQTIGMNRVFNPGADFGGISDSKEIVVSDIIHKAVLVVNEEGSEAAAATAVIMSKCASFSLTSCPEFIVDHPFLFFIYNSKNDLMLFMGRVVEL